MPGPFRYRADVLRELLRHGIAPKSTTPPEVAREYVRELYKYEIRKLRGQMIKRAFPRSEYAARVEALRLRYPVLSLIPSQFLDL